jgi:endonuclease/exonuclease/phosphatase family metal-dependent hydrolase
MPLPPPVTEDHPLTVMTFNIRLGLGPENPNRDVQRMSDQWGRNLEDVINAIRSENADIIGVQEVAGPDQLREMAQALDMHHVYVKHDTVDNRPSWWGVGILSKYPITSTAKRAMSDTRNFIIATIDVGSKKIAVATIHRNHLEFSADFLPILLGELSQVSLPTLLMGDFNIRPNARMQKNRQKRELQPVLEKFLDTAVAAQTQSAQRARVIGTGHNGHRIDYVFAQKGQFNVLDAGLVDQAHRKASNHIAYYAIVTLRNQ